MTYKELKDQLENFTEEALNKSVNFDISGFHGKIIRLKKASENWYCTDYKYPFVKLMPENKHIEEKQQGKENWSAKDWAEYRKWHAYLTSVDPVFKKGDFYFETTKNKKIWFESDNAISDSMEL